MHTEVASRNMIHYLTVQDVLWINNEVAKKVNSYKFAQLEEATFFQYGYGKSEDVIAQAGGFVEGFMKLRPFESGNKGTAFISALTFLVINGYEIELEPGEAGKWAKRLASKEVRGVDAVKQVIGAAKKPVELKPAIRTEVHKLMERYSAALEELAD